MQDPVGASCEIQTTPWTGFQSIIALTQFLESQISLTARA